MQRYTSVKLWLIAALLLSCAAFLAAADRQIFLSGAANQVLLANNGDLGFDVQFKVGELKIREIQTKEGAFDELSIEGWAYTNTVGEPQLPMLRKIIAVPIGADVRYTVNSRQQRILDSEDSQLQHRIIPAQASISKSADPASVSFALDAKAYGRNGFDGGEAIRIAELGFMRGVRLFALDFYPVRYNPLENSLQVLQELSLRVDFDHPDLLATAELLAKTGSSEFDQAYASSIFNWQADDRTSLVRYPTKLLILCPPNYTDEMQPYVEWKRQQGYIVTVTTVGTGGTVANTTSAIKTYMTGVWSAATAQDPAPTYLLIVGDTSSSGDNIIASPATVSSPSSDHVTDNFYVRLQGTDYVPEMYYGRFSVSSAAELTNIVNKTLTFQKTAMPDLSYLDNVVMIAGADASYAPTYGNGQINYGTTHYFNSTNGITSDTYLYPASASSDASVLANANAGRGYINYTAHGSETSWADPTFTVTNVNAMTNTNKYGVMVGNCCLTNAFDYPSPCFGEALIRKQNAAAVAYIGGTNSTYWNEDYYWGIGYKTPIQATAHPYNASTLGAYDAMFHTHGEAFTDWATSVGETTFMGNLAVVQSGSSYQNYYWEIYSIMGDPSLMTYLGIPSTNAATYPSQILIGATSITVTAQPYSRVALTMGGVLHGTALVPAGGSLTLPITAFTGTGTAKLVITAQNKVTIQADVAIIPNSGPYVDVSAAVYADSNNNAPEYNESGRFNVSFQNVGSVAATNVAATLTCSTPGITLTDAAETIASLAAGATSTITNAYAFNIANNIANGTSAAFTITMVSGSNTWIHNFTLNLNAPVLAFGTLAISDPAPGNNNGRLDPGETVTVTMPLGNTGAASSPSGSATLSSPTSGITVNSGSANFAAISAGGTANLTFSLSASSGMAIGAVVSLAFNATAGAYNASKTETTAVGLITETFETGNFAALAWTQGTYPWTVDNATYHEGSYSAKSGTITHNQSSTLETTRILSASGNLSFWYKVSSESGYDYLKFYIDGVVQNQWAGNVDWTQATYTLAAGTRTLKWEYMKDGSVSNGSDCAWIDDIIFPASTAYTPPTITWSPGSLSQQLTPNQTASQNLTIGNTGNAALTYTVSKPSGTATVLNESFENGGAIPTGWTQDYVNGSTAWTFVAGGYSSHPAAAYEGSYNARLYYANSTAVVTKLVSPALNLSGADSATLSFYHAQAIWVSDQDELKVYYRTSASGTWTQLAHYTANLTAWTQETITLPNLSGTYYIAFEGIAKYGYGVCVDKVVVTKNSSVSVPWLAVNGGSTYSGSIAGGGANQNMAIGFNSTGLSAGTYSSSLTISSNSATNPSVSIPVQMVVAVAENPVISVNPLSIDFGSEVVNGSAERPFTIQNTGSGTLTGSITTPAGYSVALSANRSFRQALNSAPSHTASRNTLSFSIPSGVANTYALTFAPTAETAYNGNVAISSNDSAHPTVNIAVSGTGYIPNSAPTIDLPPSWSFDKNGTQVVDMTPYVSDVDNDPLTLTVSGNTNVLVDINGLMVTFTASQNWTGTENLSFTIDDGAASNTDLVAVTVNQIVVPGWIPVTYPNNSATVYGVVTIDWLSCGLNDMVGAFVGSECRGIADVVLTRDVAYVTLLVNLAAEGETVSFRIYDYSSGASYPVLENQALNFGQVVGGVSPIALNAVTEIVLAAPIVSHAISQQGPTLQWSAVPNADAYDIYRATDPYGEYVYLATTNGLFYTDTGNLPWSFYFVRAVRNIPIRGVAK